jgi:tetratricopeptide (TPR) repeat protein
MRFKTFMLIFVAICLVSSCISKKEKALALLKDAKEKIQFNDLRGAITELDKAIENDPGLDQAWYERANTKYNLKDQQGAMADYNECIRINPGLADAFANRGQLKFEMNDKEGACADWKKAKEFGKENMEDKLQYCR